MRGLQAGASAAICLDSSAPALAAAQASAKANDLTVETRQGEAMDLLRELKAEGQRFETVVVDPPALIKRKRDHEKGLEHYAALNRAAMQQGTMAKERRELRDSQQRALMDAIPKAANPLEAGDARLPRSGSSPLYSAASRRRHGRLHTALVLLRTHAVL